MVYDEGLAHRIRDLFARRYRITEKKMFGGLAFMLNGHMCVGVTGEDLMVRVGPEAYPAMVKQPYARPMDFTGKPLKGFVYVGPHGADDDDDLEQWVQRSLRFVQSLPPK
jgi:TfoX/Sxy family transcriptional regulator of competence genes